MTGCEGIYGYPPRHIPKRNTKGFGAGINRQLGGEGMAWGSDCEGELDVNNLGRAYGKQFLYFTSYYQ